MAPYNFKPLTPAILSALMDICGPEHIIAGDAQSLHKYSHDQVPGEQYAHLPEVVVKPDSTRQVAQIIRLANAEGVPVTPRAAGSGLSGGAVPLYGGILLSVERMNRIVEIDRANLMAVVEPGVVTNQLDRTLNDLGLFFAGYPMSEEFCFIGGNVAENAGGGRAIKYGVTGRYIHGLEMVTPTGEIVQLGGKRIKDVTGYNLVQLMVGSEGTLGIFTKIVIRLLPRPKARSVMLALFKDAAQAIAVVPEIISTARLIPSAVEFMDRFCFVQTVAALKEELPTREVAAALLLEVDGNQDRTVAQEAEAIQAICRARGADHLFMAHEAAQIDRFWRFRKQIPWVLKRSSPVMSIEDIVVPIAAIAPLLPEIERLGQKYDMRIPVFGHAGDGNLHAVPMKSPHHAMQQWDTLLPELLKELYQITASMGGTISGEHGIGHKRRDYLGLVMESAQIDMLRRIKNALDPNHILNPGKIISMG